MENKDKKVRRLFQCPHNEACQCKVKNCGSCGWNPKVYNDRLKKMLASMGL